MMEELYINDQLDYSDYQIFIKNEKLIPKLIGKTDKEKIYEAGDYRIYVPFQFEKTQASIKYDPLIFGKDSTEYITNITVDNEMIYIYKSDGSHEEREYSNWAIGTRWSEGSKKLKGNQYYKYIKDLPEDQYYNYKDSWNPYIWTPRTASEGYMLRSGMTYYKGMKVSDITLLSFDIEATGLDKKDPEAEIPLLSTTYRNKNGEITKKTFDIFEYPSAKEMWIDINQYIQKTNPDIILGHNILSYDLPYLDANSTGIYWGKNKSRIIFDEKGSKVRKDKHQQYEFFNATIHGREIIDTFFLSLKYDIAREFPSYGLKAIEKHLGLVENDRTWDFQKWPVRKLINAKKSGNNEIWSQFRKYCEDDSDSPIKMFDIMIPSLFYLTQSVPKSLQQMVNEASGSQIDSIMIRAYLQDGFSLPKSSPKEEYEGAISMGIPGIYQNVRKVDVASLYPSIMLQYDIYDKKKDPERYMLKILKYLRDERLKNKKLAKDTGEQYFDDLQNSQKIIINSIYGFLGAGYLLYNFPKGATQVTKYGREILLKGVEWATGHTLNRSVKEITNEGTDDEEEKYHWVLGEKISNGLGYQLVNVDTDSFSYTNCLFPSTDEFDVELADLNSLYPELIHWEKDGKDGLFNKIIVVKAKNYILVRDGIVKIKGSSLTDQKKEPALLQLLKDFIDVLLDNGDVSKLQHLYNGSCKTIHNNFNVKEWVMKKTISSSVLNPTRTHEQNILNAINEAIDNKIIEGTQEGDKVWLYLARDGEKPKIEKGIPCLYKKTGLPIMIPNTVYRVPELYKNDHDVPYYLERVYKTLKILKNLLNMEDFPKYYLKSKQGLLDE